MLYLKVMKIGIFDSGIGGEAVAAALRSGFPEAKIDTINDRANVPYGEKSDTEIRTLTEQAIKPFLEKKYDIIVIACNTATAISIEYLREKYSKQKFIGIEPMIKTAAKTTKTGVITVCATEATLNSERYKKLVDEHAKHLTLIEPDCSNWAFMIEHSEINELTIENTINEACEKGSDVIVLGCTHYHWIKDLVVKIADGRASVLEPSDAIVRRVKQLLSI